MQGNWENFEEKGENGQDIPNQKWSGVKGSHPRILFHSILAKTKEIVMRQVGFCWPKIKEIRKAQPQAYVFSNPQKGH